MHLNHLFRAAALTLAAGALTAVSPAELDAQADAREVRIVDRQGDRVGTAYLSQTAEGVRIRVESAGLPHGEHGLHIHERGVCEPAEDFASAGSHYQPHQGSHGFLDPDGPHAGDLPVLEVGSDGSATGYDYTTARVELNDGSLLKPDGTSLVVHADPDDYLTDGGGGSGDRIACGVISPGG